MENRVIPLHSWLEYLSACKMVIALEERKRVFGYFSNDKDANQRQENELHELKARTGEYAYNNNWKYKK